MTDDAVEPESEADDVDGAEDTAIESGGTTKRKRAPSVPRDFPRKTLEDSMRVPSVIKEKTVATPGHRARSLPP